MGSRREQGNGFTLLEVLVALIIFGIITLALSSAMSSALRLRAQAEQRQGDSETARGVFSIVARDVQSAYGSMNDPNSLFVGGSGSGSQVVSNNSLLTLTALSQRILTTDPNIDPSLDPAKTGSVGSGQNGSSDPPQQPVALVRYDLDPQAGTLTRLTQAVPNLQTFQQATPGPDNVVASNILSLQMQFWDSTQKTWRDTWDFEQPNLPTPDTAATTLGYPPPTTSGASGTSGSTGASSASGSSASTSGTGSGDIGLPSAVQIKLTLRKRDGTTGNYSTIIPIVSPQLQDFPYLGGQQYDPNATSNADTNGNTSTTSGTGGG